MVLAFFQKDCLIYWVLLNTVKFFIVYDLRLPNVVITDFWEYKVELLCFYKIDLRNDYSNILELPPLRVLISYNVVCYGGV